MERLEHRGGCAIIRPSVEGVMAAQSTMIGPEGIASSRMNLSYRVGDPKEKVDRNREVFFAAAGISHPGPAQPPRLVTPQQVHGPAISVVDGPCSPEQCDAVVTSTPDLALAVMVADCLPIMLFDPSARALGLIHAGWRGSSKGVVAGAVRLMSKRLEADPARMKAHIGPSAGVCCYEVGADVADLFAGFVEIRDGRRFLDLWKFTRNTLEKAGIPADRIGCTRYCTICNADLFHSYRRDGVKSGRMMFVAVFH